jgi:hypothetical protein
MTVDATKFVEEVTRLRSQYEQMRQSTNLFPPAGEPILDMQVEHNDKTSLTIWYDDGTELGKCVRLYDIPGTLSGDILRLRSMLPSVKGHFEIEGDTIRILDRCLEPPEPIKDDAEDIRDVIAQLPLVDVDLAKHFVKKGNYRSEITNLLKCQGGSCPGKPLSEHLVQLCGRSRDGELVFKKLLSRPFVLPRFSSVEVYKRWILDMIDALSCLHSLGIVHRDLRIENCLFTEDGSSLVVCDLESRWGQRSAPEVASHGGLDSGWTTRSDVYDIGDCIKCMVYANAPITSQVEWPVPQPLQAIIDACMRQRADERPTLDELRVMVERIQIS